MTFVDLQTGDAVFIDANTLIYHFTNHAKYGAACTELVERIEHMEIQGFTPSHCLAPRFNPYPSARGMSRDSSLTTKNQRQRACWCC